MHIMSCNKGLFNGQCTHFWLNCFYDFSFISRILAYELYILPRNCLDDNTKEIHITELSSTFLFSYTHIQKLEGQPILTLLPPPSLKQKREILIFFSHFHIPYARHYKPRLVFFFTQFSLWLGLILQTIYVLKMEILQFLSSKSAAYKRERLQIESGL